MAFYQLFQLILHEIDRFGCFMLKSGFFSKSLVLFNNEKNAQNFALLQIQTPNLAHKFCPIMWLVPVPDRLLA